MEIVIDDDDDDEGFDFNLNLNSMKFKCLGENSEKIHTVLATNNKGKCRW